MPLYFFDAHDGDHLIRDTEGTELPCQEAARQDAQAVLVQLAKDRGAAGDRRSLYINVKDEAGIPIYTFGIEMAGRWLD